MGGSLRPIGSERHQLEPATGRTTAMSERNALGFYGSIGSLVVASFERRDGLLPTFISKTEGAELLFRTTSSMLSSPYDYSVYEYLQVPWCEKSGGLYGKGSNGSVVRPNPSGRSCTFAPPWTPCSAVLSRSGPAATRRPSSARITPESLASRQPAHHRRACAAIDRCPDLRFHKPAVSVETESHSGHSPCLVMDALSSTIGSPSPTSNELDIV